MGSGPLKCLCTVLCFIPQSDSLCIWDTPIYDGGMQPYREEDLSSKKSGNYNLIMND